MAQDDQPDDETREQPLAEAPASENHEPSTGEPETVEPGTAAPAGDKPRRRRRRRKRPPHAPGEAALVASGEQAPTADAAPQGDDANTLHLAQAPATPAESASDAPSPQRPGDAARRPPRRRRRRGPRPLREGAPVAPGEGEAVAAEAAVPAEGEARPRPRPEVYGPFLPRNFRPRRPRSDAAPRDGEAPREGRGPRPRGDRPPRQARARGDRPQGDRPQHDRPQGDRPQEDRPRAARADGPRRERGDRPRSGGRPGGRGRDERPARLEPKLYTAESVVDRGFEDVADEANEGATKRIGWSILKRTVADQRTTRLVSARYILKREEQETEFGNLGEARAAVNKTIQHPEKLTLSKEQHAATRSKSK
jgi:translation initiation factor IF-2